jgi:hypothetical protein
MATNPSKIGDQVDLVEFMRHWREDIQELASVVSTDLSAVETLALQVETIYSTHISRIIDELLQFEPNLPGGWRGSRQTTPLYQTEALARSSARRVAWGAAPDMPGVEFGLLVELKDNGRSSVLARANGVALYFEPLLHLGRPPMPASLSKAGVELLDQVRNVVAEAELAVSSDRVRRDAAAPPASVNPPKGLGKVDDHVVLSAKVSLEEGLAEARGLPIGSGAHWTSVWRFERLLDDLSPCTNGELRPVQAALQEEEQLIHTYRRVVGEQSSDISSQFERWASKAETQDLDPQERLRQRSVLDKLALGVFDAIDTELAQLFGSRRVQSHKTSEPLLYCSRLLNSYESDPDHPPQLLTDALAIMRDLQPDQHGSLAKVCSIVRNAGGPLPQVADLVVSKLRDGALTYVHERPHQDFGLHTRSLVRRASEFLDHSEVREARVAISAMYAIANEMTDGADDRRGDPHDLGFTAGANTYDLATELTSMITRLAEIDATGAATFTRQLFRNTSEPSDAFKQLVMTPLADVFEGQGADLATFAAPAIDNAPTL